MNDFLTKLDNIDLFTYDFGIAKSIIFIGFLCLIPFIIIYSLCKIYLCGKEVEEYEKIIDED